MNKAYVFLAGNIDDFDFIKKIIGNSKEIFGADGGGNHIFNLGLKPHLLVGDFDSIEKNILETYKKSKVELLNFSTDKDYSDGELLIKRIYDSYDEIIILGALGGRYDHSLFNIYLLEKYPKCKIINSKEELYFINDIFFFKNDIDKRVSFLPLCNTNCISLEGFAYNLDKRIVKRGSSLTLSNIILEKDACVRIYQGGFIVIKEI